MNIYDCVIETNLPSNYPYKYIDIFFKDNKIGLKLKKELNRIFTNYICVYTEIHRSYFRLKFTPIISLDQVLDILRLELKDINFSIYIKNENDFYPLFNL